MRRNALVRSSLVVALGLTTVLYVGALYAQEGGTPLPVPDTAPPEPAPGPDDGEPEPTEPGGGAPDEAPTADPGREPVPAAEPADDEPGPIPSGEPESEPVFEPEPEPEPDPVFAPEPPAEEPPAEEPPAEEPPPPPPTPVGWRAVGGRLIKQGDDAVRAWVGFPGIGAAFQTPLSRTVEIAPKVEVFYASAAGLVVPVVGLDGGGELKLKLYLSDVLALALQLELTARLAFHPDFAFGTRTGVRLLGSWDVAPDVSLLFRFGLPIEMIYHPTFLFVLPIDFGVGVEVAVTHDINLFTVVGAGPAVLASGGGTVVEAYFKGEVGFAFRF